ncbi:E3 ubiquitin-protein ligase TRIM17-like [Takifugu rubripes]|uniref:E3 ubiquitin-protein ligase TRIM17-like n=1 Tax=Takifugu rubripes TaxID=31033 RepID=UPI00114581E0|nr:E3 ubiquitin-protein ligase TRIM17-like [Takifugu rubripes]
MHKDPKVVEMTAGPSKREGNVWRVADYLQQVSCCPACQQWGVLLILPCSHTMCVRCISAGGAGKPTKSHRSAGCAVPCPGCLHPVELPCWDWSSAPSCLPKHPTVSPARVSPDVTKGPHHQRNVHRLDTEQMATPRRSRGSGPGGSPADGAVDLSEEEMEQSVFGLRFALDPASVPPSLRLSNSSLTVTYHGGDPPSPPPRDDGGGTVPSDPGLTLPEACADVVIGRGQYYWEVDVCNSSVYRIGVRSADGSGGLWLQRLGPSFSAVYDTTQEPLCTVPPQVKTIGVFLNFGGAALSFHNPLTQEHLATLPTLFHPAGVRPALCLGQGRIKLRCGLPPPLHVFLCKDSTYRGPRRAGAGRWDGDTQFQSVRKVIQKFEGLNVSDPESSFGSSCSTSAVLPDLHWTGPSE